jgi:hypothetical protein
MNQVMICNVFQYEYKGKKANGFGDFIRGCFFLVNYCYKYKYKFNILLNHPIALFLKQHKEVYETMTPLPILKTIEFNSYTGWVPPPKPPNGPLYIRSDPNKEEKFTQFLKKVPLKNNIKFVYNICFPSQIIPETREKLTDLFLPTEEIEKKVMKRLETCSLKRNFIVFHFRCGDASIKAGLKTTNINFQYMFRTIQSIIRTKQTYYHSKKILIISDNNEIKKILIKKFPLLQHYIVPITHTADVSSSAELENTMIDFYIMSKSLSIFSFTVYAHGSGFSKWVAELYKIPYVVFFVKM